MRQHRAPARRAVVAAVAVWNGRRFRWKPSIFMPRKLSRITLEVTEVCVQRLQEISEDDAQAEGLSLDTERTFAQTFAILWDSINGKRAPWASSPWVWAVTFRRLA